MAHPLHEHKAHKVEKSRVAHITRAYAHGGAVKHSDEKQDRKLVKGMIDKALHAEGHKPKHRMDKPKRKRAEGGPVPVKMTPDDMLAEAQRRHDQAVKEGRSSTLSGQLYRLQGTQNRAKGGRVKGKNNSKTIVNVITGGHPAAGAVPPGPPPVVPPPSLGVAPAAPPMAAKPPMMPPPGAGGPPPGMPMRAKGGRVNQGTAVYEESRRAGTKVQHSDGKGTANRPENLHRGRPITFARGGKVEASDGVAPATRLPGGSGGGEARLTKAHREARRH